MRAGRLFILALLPLACRGYRDPEDTEELEEDIRDKNLATKVRLALGQDPVTAPYQAIRVRCKDGEITLTGSVDKRKVKRRAEEVARAVSGVREVDNEISLSSPSSS
jgi:osmotically-inducible protein OsmY